MKATTAQNIMEQLMQQRNTNITITTKAGDAYTFNTDDNEEMIIEQISEQQVICIDGGDGGEFGTAWIDTESIDNIRI